MKISDIKKQLNSLNEIGFKLPNGKMVPAHFHVTELGVINKHFIDCGGTVRKEEVANFQLWEANDYDHRIHPEKLLQIIEISESKLGLKDLEIEVEYQGDTIGKYDLDFDGKNFLLVNKHTDCLAKDSCGTPTQKNKLNLIELGKTEEAATCTPDGGCC